MKSGNKENAMTVTLSKRLCEDASASLTSPPASKKLRLLAPLSEHLVSTGHHKPGSTGLVPVQQQHHSTARKRRHDTGTDSTAVTASPSAMSKRGKRADGRSSTAAASPNSAKTALEALLTCEGLEKDHDVEAEVAYINNRQAAAAAATDSDTAGPSNNDAPSCSSPTAAAGANSLPAQDAARSIREKRRDQDQNPRARRASAGGRSSGGRDQAGSPSSPDSAPQPAAAAAADEPGSPRVMLDLVGDKEWQRLFAVLTISDVATSRNSGSGTGEAQGGTAAAAGAGRPGSASHRFADALGTPSVAAAAAAAPMQEAPSTPVRVECSSSSQLECDVTPSRRSSFLMGEFNRVQQLRLNTPTPTPPAAAAAASAGPMYCNGHVPYMYAHDSMAL